jgi:hypothetical protein
MTDDKKLEQQQNVVQAVFGLLVFGAAMWFFFGGGLEQKAASDLQTIKNTVADHAVKQYLRAERNGTAMDRCVQAGFVAAAYLQAQDEAKYKIWKDREAADCKAAGAPVRGSISPSA